MKKLSYLLLLAVVMVMSSCSDDDNETFVVANFDSLLQNGQTEFTSTSTTPDDTGYYFADTFQDAKKIATFDHRYSSYGFAAFTFSSNLDTTNSYSSAPICGKTKSGSTYLAAYYSSFTQPVVTINNPDKYAFKSVYVCNSVYAYNGMTVGDYYAHKFTKDSWYKVTATGFDAEGTEVGHVEIYTANYTSDSDTPSADWIYLDLSPLSRASKIEFSADSSDKTGGYANTALYFCLDDLTFVEK